LNIGGLLRHDGGAMIKWPIAVRTVGQAAGGSTLWTCDGQRHLTVVAKATFRFSLDGDVSMVDAEPVNDRERHAGDHPLCGLSQLRETIPRLDAVDVIVSDHAFAQDGASRARARVAILRDDVVVLDKSIDVIGDRESSDDPPRPFDSIALSYENALGGIGFADNPIGTGLGAGTEKPPRLLDPLRPGEVCACFAAIPASWQSRKKKLKGRSGRGLQKSGAEIPAGFDWDYFHCAPADQRVSHLSGHEVIVLEGMHARREQVRFQLPSALGRVRLSGASKSPDEIPARIDMLHVDVLRAEVTMLWRANVRLPVDTDNQRLCAVVGVERPDHPIVWPERVLSSPGSADSPDFEATLDVHEGLTASGLGIAEALGGADQTVILAPGSADSPQGDSPGGEQPVMPFVADRTAELPAPASPRDGLPFDPHANAIPPATEERFLHEARELRGETQHIAVASGDADEDLAEAQRARERQEDAVADAERQAAEREANGRRQAEAKRFADEQDKARNDEAVRQREAESRKKKKGLDFRRAARGAFGRSKD
jgi:hypothetical protein